MIFQLIFPAFWSTYHLRTWVGFSDEVELRHLSFLMEVNESWHDWAWQPEGCWQCHCHFLREKRENFVVKLGPLASSSWNLHFHDQPWQVQGQGRSSLREENCRHPRPRFHHWSWYSHASLYLDMVCFFCDNALATLNVTAAFLNAPLPPGRTVVLRPPSNLCKLQPLPLGHVWLVHKAIHGLGEAPNLWSEQRKQSLTKIPFHFQRELYCEPLSEVHKSLCLIVREASLIHHPTSAQLSLTARIF